jgi:hypothetical protein
LERLVRRADPGCAFLAGPGVEILDDRFDAGNDDDADDDAGDAADEVLGDDGSDPPLNPRRPEIRSSSPPPNFLRLS